VKLTNKDKDFLESLKELFLKKALEIELKEDGQKRMVLRKNYGVKVETAFRTTRQGVRWRFHRLFNEIYVSAYCTIYWVESNFGTELRAWAMEIARERIESRKKALKTTFFGNSRREMGCSTIQTKAKSL
jgi:hypothetical protein